MSDAPIRRMKADGDQITVERADGSRVTVSLADPAVPVVLEVKGPDEPPEPFTMYFYRGGWHAEWSTWAARQPHRDPENGNVEWWECLVTPIRREVLP